MSLSLRYTLAKLFYPEIVELQKTVTEVSAQVTKVSEDLSTTKEQTRVMWNFKELMELESRVRKALIAADVIKPRSTKRLLAYGPTARAVVLDGVDLSLSRLNIIALIPEVMSVLPDIANAMTSKRYDLTYMPPEKIAEWSVEPSPVANSVAYLFGHGRENNTPVSPVEQ